MRDIRPPLRTRTRPKRGWQSSGVIIAITLAVSLQTASTPAQSLEQSLVPSPDHVLAAVESATPETVARAISEGSADDENWAVHGVAENAVVGVPMDPSEGISFAVADGTAAILLPFGAEASEAEQLAPGIVQFDNNNGSSTVPVVMQNGDLQINTVIEGPASPTRYEYVIELPAGGELVESADGVIIAMNGEGEFLFAIGTPWARDAAGKELATHYELEGNLLTQVVDHSGGDVSYPVVADPTV